MFPVFKNVGKGLQLKTTDLLAFFMWLVKSEKLLNNRIVDHLQKCGFRFQYGSWATRAVALDISKAFDRIRQAGLFHKLKSSRISGQIFGLISSFHSN